MKEDNSGGRKDRRIEFEMRIMERRMKYDEHKNTLAISNQENVSFINNNSPILSYICLLYRVEEERNKMKGCVKISRGSYGSYICRRDALTWMSQCFSMLLPSVEGRGVDFSLILDNP